MADATALQKDVEALDRVLFRLASVDDERMLAVLQGLLPQLLRLVPRSLETPLALQLKDKVLQVVAHVKTRLLALSHPQLPLAALSELLQTPGLSVFSYNLAFLFIEIGFDAASSEEKASVLAGTAPSLAALSSGQQEAFFRLLLRALPLSAAAVFPRAATIGARASEDTEMAPTTATNAATSSPGASMDALLDFLLDVTLYESAASTQTAASSESTVYGLLVPRVERLQRVKLSELPRDALYERQLQTLQFAKELEAPSSRKLPLYLAGCASFHHAIKAFSEEQLSRVLKYEETQLEQADDIRRVMALVLGSQVAQSAGAFTGTDALLLGNRSRLGDASILQALALLAASKTAPNVLPTMLQLLCQLLFGAESSRPPNVANRIKLASIRLCHWTFLHCELTSLDGLLGPVLFPTLLRLLMNPQMENEASSAEFVREFRQGVYESLAALATRSPALVVASEQAFQVLLVRCLAEEGHRTGAGANALKAFTAFAQAYGKAAAAEVRGKVRDEIIALLNGSKLFDASQNYKRVRAAIAVWCAALLAPPDASLKTQKQQQSDSDSDIAMRFALLRLGTDPDEETRRLASKALFAEPLPSMRALASSLQATYTQKDLKKSMRDVGAAESCLQFCLRIMEAARERGDQEKGNERSQVLEYVVQTFLGPQEPQDSGSEATAATTAVYETAATVLVQMGSFDAENVGRVLAAHVKELLGVASVSQERSFLLHVSTIVVCACRVEALSTSQIVSELVQSAAGVLGDMRASMKEFCGSLYVLGSALGFLGSEGCVQNLSEEQTQQLLSCFQKMVELLTSRVKEGSHFAGYPRSEEAQRAQVALLRSAMDSVGLAGPLMSFMQDAATGAEWNRLKAASVTELKRVVEWKLASVASDDQLSPKLMALKRIAIENLGRATSGLPGTSNADGLGLSADVSSSLERALDAVLGLSGEPDAELQFVVGEALVALGTHAAKETFETDRSSKFASFSENRASAIFEPGLSMSEDSAAKWGASSSWKSVLVSPAYSQLVLKTHEFFVTMLNDPNDVPKESAVKGLAYLRLRAPTEEMGVQFSDSLFRRLRCFRAFAPSADAASADDDDISPPANSRANEDATPGSRNADSSGSSGSSASASAPTVENAAYREVSNVAADVGDPELMYALLYLSTADPIWDSFVSVSTVTGMQAPTFSFVAVDKRFRASIIAKAGSQWMSEEYTHKSKLVPWLFLLKFHSNSKVSAIMGNLWEFAKGSTVLAGSAQAEKTLLRQNWALLFQFALTRLENARNFKYREAACLALMDLLNGAEADDVREDFQRLWKTASRAVDDVMEAVALTGVKLYRYLGELSLRVAASDPTCRSQLLEFLTVDGIVNKNKICQALSIDVLLRLVKALKAEDMRDRLAPLLLKLLEYLSSMEMPELQYAQFHVEKKDQLERLRVSISQSGPVGQLLELATTRLKELAGSESCVAIVSELTRGVANLLKFGVGLNTRVGTANFVVTLAGELPYELRKCNGAELLLRRVFIPYVGGKTAAENDQYGDEESRYGGVSSTEATTEDADMAVSTTGLKDGLVIQGYCRAAAYLCPLVEAPTVKEYVRAGIFAFNTSSSMSAESSSASSPLSSTETLEDEPMNGSERPTRAVPVYTSRFLLISALATRELVKRVPPIADAGSVVADDRRNVWYCTHVFPAAFVGQFAAAQTLKSAWTAVLDELPPSVLYAEKSLDAALQAVALLLVHPAWDTRRQAARALQAVFASSTYRSRLSPMQVTRIWDELLAAVPGRLWKGKGVILEALVALAAVKAESEKSGDWTVQLSTLLADECARAWKNQDLGYLESAVTSLGKLSALLSAEQTELRMTNIRALRCAFDEWLAGNVAEVATASSCSPNEKPPLPPLLIKCVLEALALMWPTTAATDTKIQVDCCELAAETMLWLCAGVATPHLGVWSVRKAAFQTLEAVVGRAPVAALSGRHAAVLERVLERCCDQYGVGDSKYRMVRVAAAGALVALMARAKDDTDVALRLVVQRERLSAAAQTLQASEEPAEQQAAFSIMTNMVQLQ